jgi:hypothetical protein
MSAVYKFIAFNLLNPEKECFDWKRFMAASHIHDAIHLEIAFKRWDCNAHLSDFDATGSE